MPTVLNTLAASEFAFRHRAPIQSQEINKRHIPNPHGIHRGFRIGVSGTDMNVAVEVDALQGDQVAVVNTLDGYTLTARKTASFDVDLTTLANKTVILALFIEFTPTAASFAEIRAYELSPSDEFTGASERGELVVLGQVVVPASGAIAASAITPTYQTPAWLADSPMAKRPKPLIKDPSFDLVPLAISAKNSGGFWELWSGTNGFKGVASNAKFGTSHLGYEHITGAVSQTGAYAQRMHVSVSDTDYLYYDVWVRVIEVPTSGTLELQVGFGDQDFFSTANQEVTLVDSSSSIDADYVRYQGVLKVTSGSNTVLFAGIRSNALLYGTSGDKIRVGYMQFYKEELRDGWDRGDDQVRQEMMSALTLPDMFNGPVTSGGDNARLSYNENDDALLRLERADQDKSSASAQVDLWLGGSLVLGTGITESAANSVAKPRLIFDALDSAVTRNYTFLMQSDSPNGTFMRTYRVAGAAGVDAFAHTFNARWDGAAWRRDTASYHSEMIESFGGGHYYYQHASTSGDGWTVWDANGSTGLNEGSFGGELYLRDGYLAFAQVGTAASGNGSNPPITDGQTNTLMAKNTPKAWFRANVNAGTITVVDGFNISAYAEFASDFYIDIADDTDADSWCAVTGCTNYQVDVRTSGSDESRIYLEARTFAGADASFATENIGLFFVVVFGAQA
jgi:hypothetical protein